MEKQLLFFMGLPGSGKDTQARLLENEGFLRLSFGEVLRGENNSFLTPEIVKFFRDKFFEYRETNKENVVVEEMVEMAAEVWMNMPDSHSLIVTGFPRSLDQVKPIFNHTKDLPVETRFCFFDVPENLLDQRTAKRANEMVLEGENPKPADSSPESRLKKRLAYWTDLRPALEFLSQKEVLKKIDGSGTIEEVQQIVQRELGLSRNPGIENPNRYSRR